MSTKNKGVLQGCCQQRESSYRHTYVCVYMESLCVCVCVCVYVCACTYNIENILLQIKHVNYAVMGMADRNTNLQFENLCFVLCVTIS